MQPYHKQMGVGIHGVFWNVRSTLSTAGVCSTCQTLIREVLTRGEMTLANSPSANEGSFAAARLLASPLLARLLLASPVSSRLSPPRPCRLASPSPSRLASPLLTRLLLASPVSPHLTSPLLSSPVSSSPHLTLSSRSTREASANSIGGSGC
ncbi:hypothetical protein ACLB2K_059677 [Fragaria x ananassa]